MSRQFCVRRLINIAVLAVMLICISVFYCAADTVPVCRSVEEASEALRPALINREEMKAVCLITDTPASESEPLISEIFEGAIAHTGNPAEGDYLRFQYNTCSASAKPVSAEGANAILFTYAVTYYDTAEQEAAVDDKVAEIIESLDLEDKTDYNKIVSIYNYVCGNVEYDYENLEDDDYYLKHTAYGALIDGKAVCQGYSMALYRLLLEAGVDNRVIFGTGTGTGGERENHTWNIVKVGDKYYNTDVTGDSESKLSHYFLKGSSSFDDDHVRSDEYITESFTAAYKVSEDDYWFDTLKDHMESLTESIKSLAKRIMDVVQ